MTRTFYLRPVGLYEPAAAPETGGPADVFSGLMLGGGPLAFPAVEAIAREGTAISRRIVGLSELFEHDWRRDTQAAHALIEALVEPRTRYAGLTMDRPRIMGIVNVTPDSFSDGGRLTTADAAVDHALKLADEGADILDIGGESTRPGSDPVTLADELLRVIPVVKSLRSKSSVCISVDTRKAEVMRQAADAGADILNDVSAFTHDPNSLETAAHSGLPVMLMHAQGDPKTMNVNPQYSDVVLDVFDYLEDRIKACEAAGIPKSKIAVDPGIGFGKHLHHNVAVLSSMSLYHGLGVPVLLGASRKKLIGQLCNVDDPKERVHGSIAAALSSIAQGVQIIRVHDVAASRQAICVWQAVSRGSEAGLV